MAAPSKPGALSNVKHVMLVLSGKGGVGKSTMTAQMALSLQNLGHKVGILDVDLCGPSIPKLLNVEGADVHQCADGWVPVYADKDQTLAVMSIGFMLNKSDEAVIWRGPKKNGMIKQFIEEVYWQELDYLLIDTPPGTSDEHISTVESLKQYSPDGAVVITTPQALSTDDVRREITFCRKMSLPILGLVENMSGFVCPHCAECSNVFSKGGGQALAQQQQVPFLGCVPLDAKLTQCLEQGQSFIDAYPNSATKLAIDVIVKSLVERVT